jgi:hypothetical protein
MRKAALLLFGFLLAMTAFASTDLEWTAPIRVAEGPAEIGPWRMNASEWDYVDDATVALGENGVHSLAWVDQGGKDVFFRRHGPDGEPLGEGAANVSRSPEVFSWMPRMTVDREDPGTVHVLWQEILFTGGSHGGDILYARSADGGMTFGEPLNLSERSEAGDGKGRLTRERWSNGSLALAQAADGSLLAAWTNFEGGLRVKRSTDAGRTFREAFSLEVDSGKKPARAPALAAGPDGRVHLFWTTGEDPRADLRTAVSEDHGVTWGAPSTVLRTEGYSDAPDATVDAEGTLHLVWGERPGLYPGSGHIAYARLPRGGDRWMGPVALANPDGFPGGGFPAIAHAGENRLVVLWELFPPGTRRATALAQATALDDDGFDPAKVLPGSALERAFHGSLQGSLGEKLDAADGRIAAITSVFAPRKDSRVRLWTGRFAE